MAKRMLSTMLVFIFVLTGCSNGVSNDQSDQQLSQHEGASETQIENTPNPNQSIDNASPASESDFIYVNNGSEVQINGYKGNGGYVVIPTEIDGSVVTRIATNAFKDAENITGITLPEKLQYIGDNAFFGLEKLTGVLIIPKTVTEIGRQAFRSTCIKGLVLRSTCEIGNQAFTNTHSLEFVYVEEGYAPEVGTWAFSHAEALSTVIFPDTMVEIEDEAFKGCNNMVIYTNPGSTAEAYANRNFINVNTEAYAEQVEYFSKVYGEQIQSPSENTKSITADVETTNSNITETEASFYANVLNTINSLKQIHANPDTIEILGAVVMNPDSDDPRTIVYISYVGLDSNEYTDYFWKDMNEPEIKAKFAKDNYSGNDGRMPIEQLDLAKLAYYESCGTYVPNLSPISDIYLDK